jgi:hypothetical protein
MTIENPYATPTAKIDDDDSSSDLIDALVSDNPKGERILKIAGLTLLGIVVIGVFISIAIETILIPNSCYYHTRDPGKIISLLFDFPASENGHPVASHLNVILSSASGGLVGLILGIMLTKKTSRS